MELRIKIEGGYADEHKVSLNDIATLASSIQLISKNYEKKKDEESNTDIYLTAEHAGSYELILGLLNSPITQGIASAFLYDLVKEISSYVFYNDKKTFIRGLMYDIYTLSLELAESEYYDIKFEEKQQELEKKEKILNIEHSTFNAIHDITKLVKESKDEKSNKPTSILFSSKNLSNEDIEFSIKGAERKKIYEVSQENLVLDDMIVIGILTNMTKGTKAFFKIKSPFFGNLKIYIDEDNIGKVTDYFKSGEQIKILMTPILKIGESIKTREGKLVEIL